MIIIFINYILKAFLIIKTNLWIVISYYENIIMGFKKSTAKLLLSQRKFLKDGKILDVGCGEKIYRNIFLNNEYIGIDVKVSGRKKKRS